MLAALCSAAAAQGPVSLKTPPGLRPKKQQQGCVPKTPAGLSEALLNPARRGNVLCGVGMGTAAHHKPRPFSQSLQCSAPKAGCGNCSGCLVRGQAVPLVFVFVFLPCATGKGELGTSSLGWGCLLASSAQPLCGTQEMQPGAAPCSSLPCLGSGHPSSSLEVMKRSENVLGLKTGTAGMRVPQCLGEPGKLSGTHAEIKE